MSETQQQVPPLMVLNQYVKDLSFEVPGAPMIFATMRAQPRVDINLDVQARRLSDAGNQFEVVIAVRAEAKDLTEGSNEATVFVVELAYAGLFALSGIPDEQVEPVLLVECPRILFPFARNIIADVTRNGAMPPVMLQPIDFLALWQSRRAQAAAAASAETVGNA